MPLIHIDAVIGTGADEISSKLFKSQLPTGCEPLTVYIHSEGGSLFEAFAIFDAIDSYQGEKKAVVSSMAFSAASLLLCAFDEVEITPNGYTMIHSPYMDGDKELSAADRQLLKGLRERLIGIYAKKTGHATETIERLINQETFFDAEASVSLGLVNQVARRESRVAAKLPQHVLAKLRSAADQSATHRWKTAVAEACETMSHCKAVLHVDRNSPGLRQPMIAEANTPIAAKSRSDSATATTRWKTAVAQARQTMTHSKAVLHVDQQHPGLRQSMIAEANAR